MSKFFKILLAWVGAASVSALAASITSSLLVQNALIEVGATIDWSTRFATTSKDLVLLQALIPLLAVAFLIAFIIASLCYSKFGGKRLVWFTIAGASSFFVMLQIMVLVFDLMPFAGARDSFGLLLMCLCGAIGGWFYQHVTSPKTV